MDAHRVRRLKNKIKAFRCHRESEARIVYVGSYYYEPSHKFKVIIGANVYEVFVDKLNGRIGQLHQVVGEDVSCNLATS